VTRDDLKRQMILLCHKVPFLDGGSTIKLHDNGSGRQWCYCETCQDLGALDAEGNMYGGATRESCRGSITTGKRNTTFAQT
jgi:hypothetical protein